MSETLKLTVTGEVAQAFYDEKEMKMSLGIAVTPYYAEAMTEFLQQCGFIWSGENYPIKELEDGRLVFKTSTSYTPDLRGINEEQFPLLGVNSKITAYVKLKSGTFGKKRYVAAYLVGVDVHDYVEFIKTEVFDSGDFENPFDAPSPNATPSNDGNERNKV